MVKHPINSVINWNYFCLNFRHDFIDKCWENDIELAHHLSQKFLEIYKKKGTGLMPFFLCELSFNNQEKLINWVNENYVSFEHLKTQ